MKFKVEIKRLFSVILFCIIHFFSFSNDKIFNTNDHKLFDKDINEIWELIISDANAARKRIDDKLLENQNNEYWLDYEILKIELYRYTGDFTHMKMELFNALRNVKPNTKIENKLMLDYYRAMNYYINNQDEKLEYHLKKTLRNAQKVDFKFLEGNCMSTFGRFYSEEGNYKLGKQYLDSATIIFNKLNDKNSNLIVNIRRGICEFWQGKPKIALATFHESLKFCERNNLKVNECYLLVNIAEAHLYCRNIDSASYYYYKFLRFKKQADIRDVFQAYLGLEELYNYKNRIDSAYFYSQLKNEINDSIKKVLDKNLGEEIEKNFEKELSEKLIRNKDNVIKSVRDNNRKILLIVVISTTFLLIIISLILNAYRTKNKLNKVLLEQQKSIIEKNNVIDIALKEKVILLKEIHHRVKNNLQIISSLLNLQARTINDQNALNALEEGKERIQAIALIHEKLYKNESFASIDMENYIEDLAEQLHKTYIPNSKEIIYQIEAKDIKLNLDTAVPLGLIICELITNSFKHAFNNQEKGLLKIQISTSISEKLFYLKLEDNGSGINTSESNLKEGIGLEIIEALTEQLEGSIQTKSSSEGTTVDIQFKEV